MVTQKQIAYPVHLAGVVDFTIQAVLGVPFAIITSVKVQDRSTEEWYTWDREGGWSPSTPKCHPGANNLYIDFWAVNQGTYFYGFMLRIIDDTDTTLMNKTGGAGYLEGIGIGVTVDMPARDYGIKLTVVP